jgi:hypothetical protein
MLRWWSVRFGGVAVPYPMLGCSHHHFRKKKPRLDRQPNESREQADEGRTDRLTIIENRAMENVVVWLPKNFDRANQTCLMVTYSLYFIFIAIDFLIWV